MKRVTRTCVRSVQEKVSSVMPRVYSDLSVVLMPVLHCPGGHTGLEWQRGRLTRGQRHQERRTGEGHTDLQPGLALRVRELRTEAGGGGELGLGADHAMADGLRTGFHPDRNMMEEVGGSGCEHHLLRKCYWRHQDGHLVFLFCQA